MNELTAICYNKADFVYYDQVNIENLTQQVSNNHFVWVNAEGGATSEALKAAMQVLNVPDYLRENLVVASKERPDLKYLDDCFMFNLRMVWKKEGSSEIVTEQVAILLGTKFILTVQEGVEGDVFGKVRERLKNGKSKSRQGHIDFLCYELLNAVIEAYARTLEKLGDEIDTFEDALYSVKESKQVAMQLHSIRDGLLDVRRAVYPLRDILHDFDSIDDSPFQKETNMYMRGLYNRAMQTLETIDIHREMLTSLQDLYLSNLSQRLNEIMKVLTIITTIFIPLSFITGFYGMNLIMPENKAEITYPIVIGVMIVTVTFMLHSFKKKKWL